MTILIKYSVIELLQMTTVIVCLMSLRDFLHFFSSGVKRSTCDVNYHVTNVLLLKPVVARLMSVSAENSVHFNIFIRNLLK